MIGAVVVLFNPTEKEIKNITTYRDKVEALIIVDNSEISNEQIINKYVEMDTRHIYIKNLYNEGLCKALNKGIGILKSWGYEWCVVFDSDSVLIMDIFTAYKNILETYKDKSKVAVFSPVHTYDRKERVCYEGFKKIEWAMTSGWLLNIPNFVKVGGFFEKLFVDGLDMDYCHRAKEKGYEIIECGQVILEHHPAKTQIVKIFSKIFKYGVASPERYYMQSRALIWNVLRYKKFSDVMFYTYKLGKVILLFPQKWQYIKAIISGTKKGIELYLEYKRGECG